MTHPTPTPTRQHPTTPPAPAPAPPGGVLSFEARLAAADAAMSVALDRAAVAYEVNTAHIPTGPVDLADVITTAPVTDPPPIDLYPTPVAGLLQRAHHRLLTDGWCTGALVNEQGARCLLGAIRREAAGDHRLERDAIEVLLDAIRRRFGTDVESVPDFNDAWAGGGVPLRTLLEGASLADVRGL
ncbi:DUF6197 family protein [Actinacidiphila glaucinigra]|uniref:DUF6197 family protein n=1 Tax=Actinacidiphila glaucinigra TaxID=235986 RepID=UPI0035DBAD87